MKEINGHVESVTRVILLANDVNAQDEDTCPTPPGPVFDRRAIA